MMDTIHSLRTAIAVSTAGLTLALVGFIVLYVAYDRQRARFLALREYMRVYMAKALNDRNDKVRIPAEQVQALFELEDVRAIPKWKAPHRVHPHPATLSPARRGKL